MSDGAWPILDGNVEQKNADIAEAKKAAAAIAQIANRYCAPEEDNSAGFPQFNAQVPLPPSAKSDPPLLPASEIGSEKAFQEQKGKGKNYEKGGKPELTKGGKPEFAKGGKPESEKGGKPEFAKGGKDEKGGKEDKGGKNAAKGEFKGEFKGDKGNNKGPKGPTLPVPKASGSKCARISEEPAEVVEANSNKNAWQWCYDRWLQETPWSCWVNFGCWKCQQCHRKLLLHLWHRATPRHYSQCCSRDCQQPHKWDDHWVEATIDYEEVDFNVPQPAWIKDTYHWSCTLLRMGRFAEKPITYHDFVVKGFNKSMEECRYAKKMIGQFRKKLTPTPRTQGPDFCAFLIHCRVDAFLNAGYVYQREFAWDWWGWLRMTTWSRMWLFLFCMCNMPGICCDECSLQNLWASFAMSWTAGNSLWSNFNVAFLHCFWFLSTSMRMWTQSMDINTGLIRVHRYFAIHLQLVWRCDFVCKSSLEVEQMTAIDAYSTACMGLCGFDWIQLDGFWKA